MSKQTVTERVREAMNARGMNQNQLKERGGFKDGYLSNLFKRNSDGLHPKTIAKLAEALEVRYDWLARGEGEMGLPKSASEEPASDTQPRKVNDEQGEPTPEPPSVEPSAALAPATVTILEPMAANDVRRFGDSPGWTEAEAEARREFPDLPDWSFRLAANMRGANWPRHPTPQMVARWATTCFMNKTADEKAQIEGDEVRAAIAKWRAEQRSK